MVKNKILEAYFGRLGANIDPRWQKFQSMAIAYQNIRLLSMAVLTSLVDAGQIGWRAESATASLKALGRMFDGADREAQYEMARLIGAIEDNVTDHVLNDQTTTKFMSPKAKQWNEKFFRMIGMHQWTNMTRVMAMTAGVDFMDRHADLAAAGDATSIKHLEELGVTAQDIHDWQDAGRPTNDLTEADSHSRVISALNTFIDEAIVRPDATVRPGWASDRNWQIMFHLKSFMWGYQETLLMRIWLRAKAEPTVMKSLQSGGLSAALLVAMTLPLAVAGYELRRLLSWWGNPPEQSKKRGWDYAQEVIERAGYLGLVQFVADAEQAQEFGRLSLLSAAGPSLTQLEEFITDDWASIATRATPVLAQTGAGRKIVRDLLRGD